MWQEQTGVALKTRTWPVWAAVLLAGLSLAPAQDELIRKREKPIGRTADGVLINVDDKLPTGQRQQGLDRADGRPLDQATGRISDRPALRQTDDRIRGLPNERVSIEDGSVRGLNESAKGAKPLDGAGSRSGWDKQTEKSRLRWMACRWTSKDRQWASMACATRRRGTG